MNKRLSLGLKRIALLPPMLLCGLLVVPAAPIWIPALLIDFAFDTDYAYSVFEFVCTPADIVGKWMELENIL